MNFTSMKAAALATLVGVAGSQAFASGFEKTVPWGARTAGVGGIATPYITGSQALYFNPAGLAADKPGHDVSLNVSPVWSKFEGPINYANDTATSSTSLSTPFGLIYGGTIDSQFGFGVGGYTSAGAMAKFDDVAFTGITGANANVKTDLKVNELGVGAGYKINDALKVGVTWRIVMGTADFAFVQPNPLAPSNPGAFSNLEVNGVKTTNFTGFKLGTQYRLSERTLIGVTYRSEVELKGDGTYGGRGAAGPGSNAFNQTTATAKTTLPMQAVIGATHDYEKWRSLAEYSWTQYSRVGDINVDGPVSVGATTLSQGVVLHTNWRDQHQLRLGGEYMGMMWPVRIGYIYTSPVTNAADARAQFLPPGSGHTITAGTGQTFDVMGNPLQFDVAGDYGMSSGDSEGGAAAGASQNSTGNFTRSGTFKAMAYSLHLGVGYSF